MLSSQPRFDLLCNKKLKVKTLNPVEYSDFFIFYLNIFYHLLFILSPGETPFDICEDPEIKERLIQLKEQRVRLEQPRVRRSRSASTRTQSIRRTSLREKMNTTKKDVQDEKLYFIQSFDAMPKMDQMVSGIFMAGREANVPTQLRCSYNNC